MPIPVSRALISFFLEDLLYTTCNCPFFFSSFEMWILLKGNCQLYNPEMFFSRTWNPSLWNANTQGESTLSVSVVTGEEHNLSGRIVSSCKTTFCHKRRKGTFPLGTANRQTQMSCVLSYLSTYKPSPVPFASAELWFFIFKLNWLGWHWLIKLYRFQLHNSMMHHLYIAFFVYHPKSNLLSPYVWPSLPFSTPHPSLLITTLLLSLFMSSCLFLFLVCSHIVFIFISHIWGKSYGLWLFLSDLFRLAWKVNTEFWFLSPIATAFSKQLLTV